LYGLRHVKCLIPYCFGIIYNLLTWARKVSLVHRHQWSLHFYIFESFKTSHFYVSKNYSIKYIEIYIQEAHTQKKVSLKNTLYFEKYKKVKFLAKRYTILLLFTIKNLSFYISQNTTYFLAEFFCICSSCIYLSIYLII
jgi:hypothetical protein